MFFHICRYLKLYDQLFAMTEKKTKEDWDDSFLVVTYKVVYWFFGFKEFLYLSFQKLTLNMFFIKFVR